MEVNKRLARDAKKKGICEEWYGRLIDTKGKDNFEFPPFSDNTIQ